MGFSARYAQRDSRWDSRWDASATFKTLVSLVCFDVNLAKILRVKKKFSSKELQRFWPVKNCLPKSAADWMIHSWHYESEKSSLFRAKKGLPKSCAESPKQLSSVIMIDCRWSVEQKTWSGSKLKQFNTIERFSLWWRVRGRLLAGLSSHIFELAKKCKHFFAHFSAFIISDVFAIFFDISAHILLQFRPFYGSWLRSSEAEPE